MAMNVKWKYEPYAFYNKRGIEERLGEMAEQGWFIERMGFFWKYRKGMPKKRTYNIVYMENPDTEKKEHKQKEFVEYCEAAGWDLVCVMKDMLVFSHDGEHPVPIETDAKMELENLDDIMRSCEMQNYGFNILYAILWGGIIINNWKDAPFYELTNNLNIWVVLCMFIVLLTSTDGIVYSRWLKKAYLYVQECDELPPVSNSVGYRTVVDWLRCGFICVFLVWSCVIESMYVITGVSIGILGISLSVTMKNEKKRLFLLKGMVYKPRHWDVLIVVVVSLALIYGGLLLSSMKMMVNEDEELAKAPVSLGDIIAVDEDKEQFVDYLDGESIFVKYISLYHDIYDSDEDLALDYAYGKVKMDKLYDFAKSSFFSQEEINLDSYTKVEDAVFDANAVYEKVLTDDNISRVEYVFLWNDAFAKVRFENVPTEEQVRIVAEKLGNIK